MKTFFITIACSILFVFSVIFWGAYKETQLQYAAYNKLYTEVLNCRMNQAIYNIDKVCGPIPTLDSMVPHGS